MAPAEPIESIDHYANLGLPSGPESLNVTSEDIKNAYRTQSRLRHPDKRPDDPNATADFQLLKSSFDVLMDESKRSVYDAKIRAGIEKRKRDELYGAKRRKLATDLEERERMAERGDGDVGEEARRRRNEKAVAAAMKKELEEFQAKRVQKAAFDYGQASRQGNGEEPGASLDKERVLKVSWKKEAGDYTSARLREIFEQYGKIEDVVIRSKKNRGSALIVMSSKDAVVAATRAEPALLLGNLGTSPGHQNQRGIKFFWRKHYLIAIRKLNCRHYLIAVIKRLLFTCFPSLSNFENSKFTLENPTATSLFIQ